MTSKNWYVNHALLLFGLLLLIVAGITYDTNKSFIKVNWLEQSDWSHMPGAKQQDNTVRFSPTGLAINHTDTSVAQPNPPVNIRGSYVKFSGEVQIDMTVSGIENNPIIQLYGQVPVVYDEWRQEHGSARVSIRSEGVTIQVWDGSAATFVDQRTYPVPIDSDAKITIGYRHDFISVSLNDRTLGFMPNHDIFSNGTIWFGADAPVGTSGWSLHSLTARTDDINSLELIPPSSFSTKSPGLPTTLRKLAEQHPRELPIGVATSVNPLYTDDKYRHIVLSEFSMLTPENSMKPQALQPLRGVFTFQNADSLVEAALENDMQVHGHALVLGKATPEWMQKTELPERKQVMIDHISAVVGRYKNNVAQWDVVNEPMSEDFIDYKNGGTGIRKHMWLDAMDEEYIDIAFKAAHAADPKAKLFLNDFGLEKDGERWDAFIKLLERLQARKVPIDGVGFEAHVYHSPADTIDPAVLKKHIKQLASMGIESRISEIDVLGDDPTYQARQYSEVLQVCLSEPTCTSYGIWGVTDLYGSTALSDRYPIMLGDSLLWDENYKPKPALTSLQNVLR